MRQQLAASPQPPAPPPPTPATPAFMEGGGQEDGQGRKLPTRRKAKTGPADQTSLGSKSHRYCGGRELDRAPSWVSLRGLFVSSTSASIAEEKKGADKQKNKDKDNVSSGGSSGRLRCSVSICNSRGSSEVMVQQGGLELAPPVTAPSKGGSGGRGGGCYRKAAASSRSSSSGCDLVQLHARKNKAPKVPLKEIDRNAPPAATTPASASASASSSFSSSSRSVGSSSRAVVISSSSSSTASSSSVAGSFRPLRRFSVCQECHSVVDPVSRISRDTSLRSSLCPCPDCGEVFVKPESLELHQRTRHAVVELGPEDTSRNIVEIIFQSSWLKKQPASCKIDRILKINNTKSTISRFEDYRDAVRSRAKKAAHQQLHPKNKAGAGAAAAQSYPRCAADGNELLRFHCATVACSVGAKGSTSLCAGLPRGCGACGIIRDGFRPDGYGKIRTMATSGRAHDTAQAHQGAGIVQVPPGVDARSTRAMLVCRVIAGRVMRGGMQDAAEEYDSVAGPPGVYSSLDELFVFNARAILPCFLVVYREA